MKIPTEPIGSIPRPSWLIDALMARDGTDAARAPLYEAAIPDTIERFEAPGSPVIGDGEPAKYQYSWTYCVHGLPTTAPDGFGPFPYQRRADSYLEVPLRYAPRAGEASCDFTLSGESHVAGTALAADIIGGG